MLEQTQKTAYEQLFSLVTEKGVGDREIFLLDLTHLVVDYTLTQKRPDRFQVSNLFSDYLNDLGVECLDDFLYTAQDCSVVFRLFEMRSEVHTFTLMLKRVFALKVEASDYMLIRIPETIANDSVTLKEYYVLKEKEDNTTVTLIDLSLEALSLRVGINPDNTQTLVYSMSNLYQKYVVKDEHKLFIANYLANNLPADYYQHLQVLKDKEQQELKEAQIVQQNIQIALEKHRNLQAVWKTGVILGILFYLVMYLIK